jgi:hypothetical protein
MLVPRQGPLLTQRTSAGRPTGRGEKPFHPKMSHQSGIQTVHAAETLLKDDADLTIVSSWGPQRWGGEGSVNGE